MKRPFVLFGLVALAVAVLAFSNGLHATPNTPARLNCSAGCGHTYQMSFTILSPEHSILGKPTLSAAFIDRVLATAHSPAAGTGEDFYQLSLHYGIDDAWPLAFFHHESDYGTTGEARVTYSIGNSRCIATRPCIDQARGGYAQMWSWVDGIAQWYQLMRTLYINQWGRSTEEQNIPKYAPTSDGNDEQAYINAIVSDVAQYRAESAVS